MKILNLTIVIALFVALLGCVGTDSEIAAIALSDTTIEGQTANTLIPLLLAAYDCSAEELVETTASIQAIAGEAGVDAFDLVGNAEEAEAVLEATGLCGVTIQRTINAVVEDQQYQLVYTASANDSCNDPSLMIALDNYRLVIDVDLVAGTATVSEGKLFPEIAAKTSELYPALGITGNCTAPILHSIGFIEEFVGVLPDEPGPVEPEEPDEPEEPEVIVSGFNGQWNPDQPSSRYTYFWEYNEEAAGTYYVAVDQCNSGNCGPTGQNSIDAIITCLKAHDCSPFMGDDPIGAMSTVYHAEDEVNETTWGGTFTPPVWHRIHGYLLDSDFNLVADLGAVEIAFDTEEEKAQVITGEPIDLGEDCVNYPDLC